MLVRAYFFTSVDADKAKAALSAGYAVQGPFWVSPHHSRSVLLEVQAPTGLDQHVSPRDWSRIISLVQRYFGWVDNTED